MTPPVSLIGLSPDALKAALIDAGLPEKAAPMRARQLWNWIYVHGAKDFGAPLYIGIAFFVLLCIILISRYGNGLLSNISVLLGIAAGFVLTGLLGMVSFAGLSQAAWFAPVIPFHFGMPKFDLLAITSMTLVMIVTLIESMGGIFATALALNPGVAALPLGLAIVLPLLAGALAGGVWGGIAGGLKAKFGTNEVISTLLLTFIALLAVYWAVQSEELLRQPRTSSASVLDRSPEMPETCANSVPSFCTSA